MVELIQQMQVKCVQVMWIYIVGDKSYDLSLVVVVGKVIIL
jgi:hypothetical protein